MNGSLNDVILVASPGSSVKEGKGPSRWGVTLGGALYEADLSEYLEL